MSSASELLHQQLTLVPCVESHASGVGSSCVRVAVPFLDFVVDGLSLRTMLTGTGYGGDLVTPLCRAWIPAHVEASVDLLLRGNGASGEPVDMLVCSVCGDRGCGAVVADVTVKEEFVTWSNWRWANFDPAGGEDVDVPTMRFQRSPYEDLLASAAASVAALPYDEPAERPRVLWPWQWGWRLPRNPG